MSYPYPYYFPPAPYYVNPYYMDPFTLTYVWMQTWLQWTMFTYYIEMYKIMLETWKTWLQSLSKTLTPPTSVQP